MSLKKWSVNVIRVGNSTHLAVAAETVQRLLVLHETDFDSLHSLVLAQFLERDLLQQQLTVVVRALLYRVRGVHDL